MRYILHTSIIILTIALLLPVTASAATLAADAKLKGQGSDLYAAPTTFKMKGTFSTTPTINGNQQLKAIQVDLPESILYNQTKFSACNTNTFLASGICPSKTKLGTAVIIADGSTAVGDITAKVTMYYGQGFTILSRVIVTEKAPIDEKIVGMLRSSDKAGYGMQLYLPMTNIIRQPLGPGSTLFPTIKSVDATLTPPTRTTKVYDSKKKKLVSTKVPLAGLPSCKGKLPVQFSVLYSDSAAGTAEGYNSVNGRPLSSQNETASTSFKCKK